MPPPNINIKQKPHSTDKQSSKSNVQSTRYNSGKSVKLAEKKYHREDSTSNGKAIPKVKHSNFLITLSQKKVGLKENLYSPMAN